MVKLPRLKPLYAFCTASMDVPILLTLSDMSVMDMPIRSAAFAWSPPSELISAAADWIEVSM